MKRLIFSAFLIMLACVIKADEIVQVPVYISSFNKKANNGHIRHAPLRTWRPIVETDGNYIYISSCTIGSCIDMFLKDDEANLIYNISSSASSPKVSLDIPHGILEVASTITITIDGITYIGEF